MEAPPSQGAKTVNKAEKIYELSGGWNATKYTPTGESERARLIDLTVFHDFYLVQHKWYLRGFLLEMFIPS